VTARPIGPAPAASRLRYPELALDVCQERLGQPFELRRALSLIRSPTSGFDDGKG